MAYQDDLILSMYGRGEPGLAMGNIPPGKGGSPGQPYQPPKEDPNNPYVPAKPRPKLANLADGEPDPSIMNYVTAGGFFLDGQGRAYMQTGCKLYDAGEYNPDIHGLPVPLVQQMQINPDLAAMYSGDEVGSGVIIPQDFSPPQFRYFPHYRTPAIKQQELDHFNNFIESMGGGLDRVQRRNPMMIAHAGPGQFYTEEGEVTDVSPYMFNRNATELEVPWLKDEYEQNLPQYQKKHMNIYHGS
tara:strand:+ start:138 stop:866 length:729 start_codon:yes stop_codon:yes gene_type:complete